MPPAKARSTCESALFDESSLPINIFYSITGSIFLKNRQISALQVLHLILEPCHMTGVLLLSLFQRLLGVHQAVDYISPVVLC